MRESLMQLKMVGRVAVIFSTAATGGLVALLWVLGEGGDAYGAIVGSGLRAESRLDVTLWFFGLLMCALAGVSTWILALYASFRFAGPLYRFARNLQQTIDHDPTPLAPLRGEDILQRESSALHSTVGALTGHYRALGDALAHWQSKPGEASAQAVIGQLKALDSRVRL